MIVAILVENIQQDEGSRIGLALESHLIEKGQETVERFPATPFTEDLQIESVLTNKLNKLRIGLPEAYFYWAKTSQLLAR